MNPDTELTHFKQDINLVEYAQAQGYELDRKESSRASAVMRRGEDKIIVATDQDGHGIYFSVRDDNDHGTIIDFVQRRQAFTLGQVRRELRPWLDALPPSSYSPGVVHAPMERLPKPERTSADRSRVLAAWLRMQPATRHPYLERHRMLDAQTLADSRFADRVRIDARGNAIFPHYDRNGLCGYEAKNRQFTGFSPGGVKGLWYSSNLRTATRVVIVESAIDAMSHAQLKPDPHTAYISVGGNMNPDQPDLLRGAMEKAAARGARIVIATDLDRDGEKYVEQIKGLAPPNAVFEREKPAVGKDWNDQLKLVHVARDNRAPAMRVYEKPSERTMQR